MATITNNNNFITPATPISAKYNPNYELTVVFTVLLLVCMFLGVVGLAVASGMTVHRHVIRLFQKRQLITAALSFVCLVTFFQMLSFHTERERTVNLTARLLVELLGTVVMFIGTCNFFVLPGTGRGGGGEDGQGRDRDPKKQESRGQPLNHKDRYFGTFSIIIALFMILPSGPICYGACHDGQYLYFVGTLASIIQKLVQSGVYCSNLQYKTPLRERRTEAAWFLRTLSLLNFMLWLNDLINLSSSNDKFLRSYLPGGSFAIVSVMNDSLVVEYRLLMSMLFLEQSLAIRDNSGDERTTDNASYLELPHSASDNLIRRQEPLNEERLAFKQYRLCSLIFGVVVIFLQLVNIFEYTEDSGLPNIVGILSDILLVVLGLFLYLEVRRNLPTDYSNENPGAVDLLLTIMGIFGILYWLFRATVVSAWAKELSGSYYDWNAVKYTFRVASTSFLVFMFTSVSRHVHMFESVQASKQMHMFLPAFWLTIVACYVSSIIAAYKGKIEENFTYVLTGASIGYQILYQAGGPIHLGFCLHTSVHFGYLWKAFCDGLVMNGDGEDDVDILQSSTERRHNSLDAGIGGSQQHGNQAGEREPLLP